MAARVLARIKDLTLFRATSALHDVWPEGLVPPQRPPSSSSAGRLQPERPAPRHRMPVCTPLASSLSTSRAAAGLVLGRMDHRRFGTSSSSPHHLAGLPGDEEAPLVEGHWYDVWKEIVWQSGVLLPPHDTGVIPADLGSYQAQTADGLRRLPVLNQTSFFTKGDIDLTNWVTLRDFMDKNPAVTAINLPLEDWPLHANNPLISTSDEPGLMLTPAAKVLWQSLIDLVDANKARGYCISLSLTEDNLLVSCVTGQFALKKLIVKKVPEDPSKFVGFETVKTLFIQMLVQQYGGAVIELLGDDVSHLITMLGSLDQSDTFVGTRHPCLMSDEGWARLLTRIHKILTVELMFSNYEHRQKAMTVLDTLSAVYEDVGSMHPFFQYWLAHSEETAKKMSVQTPQVRFSAEVEQGRRLLTMLRNGVMHSHSWPLYNLATKMFGKKKVGKTKSGKKKVSNRVQYNVNHVIQLLQFKCSLILPEALRLCKRYGMWKLLSMDTYYRKHIIHPITAEPKPKVHPKC